MASTLYTHVRVHSPSNAVARLLLSFDAESCTFASYVNLLENQNRSELQCSKYIKTHGASVVLIGAKYEAKINTRAKCAPSVILFGLIVSPEWFTRTR